MTIPTGLGLTSITSVRVLLRRVARHSTPNEAVAYLSKAVMSGFILGFALGIIIDQSHKLLRVDSVSGSYVQELWGR